MEVKPVLHHSWLQRLQGVFQSEEFLSLKQFLLEQKREGRVFYPPGPEIFRSLNHTPFDRVKVVLLGQDPYHGPSQAHGLSFSVRKGQRIPPSLQNIYKELQSDLGLAPPQHGELTAWSEQGVLLLNAVLTVEAHRAGSHRNQGWEILTDRILVELNRDRDHLVFFLFGRDARQKKRLIDCDRHFVIEAAHPSPLSAARGFFGCKAFSRANAYLREHGLEEVNWKIPE